MINISKAITRYLKIRQEAGNILILALVFMLTGVIIIVPLLGLVTTSLKNATSYDTRSESLYAADAGIEDAMWQIKYDRLKGTISDYDQYSYLDNDIPRVWSYDLPEQVNGKDVTVQIRNIWVPDISPVPSSSEAKSVAESEKLIVTGGLYRSSSYKIVITFTPDPGNVLNISEIGVWLPPGLTFETGSSNLETSGQPYTKTPVTSAYKGGQKITWTYSTPIAYTSLPGVNTGDSPMTATIIFSFVPSVTTTSTSSVSAGSTSLQVASTSGFPVPGELALPGEPAAVTYTGITATSFTGIPSSGGGAITLSHSSGSTVKSTASPDAVSWINTTGVTGLSYSWDSEVRVFGIRSISKKADGSEDTTVETYVAKSELKKMNRAMNGDYYATGGSLMIDTNADSIRDTKQDSAAPVSTPTLVVATPTPIYADNGVPEDANVGAAYMYWASWYRTEYGRMSVLFFDDTSTFANWTNGEDWRIDTATNFIGHNSDDSESAKTLTKTNSIDLHSYSGSSYITTLSWEQWVNNTRYLLPLGPDECTDFSNWTKAGSSVWTLSSGKFKGMASSGTDTNLTLTNSLDLSGASSPVTVSWTQAKSGTLATGDNLDLYLSGDNGDNWTFQTHAIQGPSTYPGSFSWTIPSGYLTHNFKIKLTLTGFGSTKYCTVDDIKVTLPSAPTYSSSDAIKFAISKDGGASWSNYTTAVTADKMAASAFDAKAVYQYNIPRDYLTSIFKIKFYISGFDSPGKYFGIDNIRICWLQPKEGISFKIDPTGSGSSYQQVYFDSSGNPAVGTDELTASRTQALITYSFSASASPIVRGFAYTCFRDVTELVRTYAEQPSGVETNFNGHGRYKVKGDLGDSGSDTTWYQQAHAGWSLVIIYTSADTLGHQLYLYDDFIGSGYSPTLAINVDFDKDGQDGGTISGFVVPDPIKDENGTIIEKNAAKLSVFVTEGDVSPTGSDYLEIKGTSASTFTKLWDGTTITTSGHENNKTSPNNAWAGKSMVLGAVDGVDVDTMGIDPTASPPQYITWTSSILAAKDTSASINLVTHNDYFFLVYMIISFRSETTTGGSLSYLIHN
jgi:hypothetical protein